MPYIITNRGDDPSAGRAFEQLGQNITELVGLSVRQREAKRRAAQAEAIANRRMDLEEQRAKAMLLREENKAAEREADMEGSIKQARGEAAGAAGEALPGALEESMKGGMLGPFGFLNKKPLEKAAARAQKIQATMEVNIEQARRMSPAAADRFLRRETENLKQSLLVEDYGEEFAALENALTSGKFEDPFMVPKKGDGPQEPSEEAMAKAEGYKKLLTQSLKEKKPPGGVLKLLESEYKKHDGLVARKAAWEDSDVRAKKMLTQLQDIAASIPAGVDPETGKDSQEEFAEKLASAASGWASTNDIEFRRSNNPRDSLAGLQKILFGARAGADPEKFVRQQQGIQGIEAARGERAGTEKVRGQAAGPGLDVHGALQGLQGPAPQTAPAAPGAGQPVGVQPPAQGPSRGKQTQAVERFLASELSGIVQREKDPEKRAGLLMDRLEDQGYDLNDPAVQATLEQAIMSLTGR